MFNIRSGWYILISAKKTFLVATALFLALIMSVDVATALQPVSVVPNKPLIPIYGSVTQSQTNTHQYYSSGKPQLNVDLYWGNTANSLTLKIVKPDGSTQGTYSDASDGTINGRISLVISNPQDGTWTFYVTGQQVTGTQSYTLTIS